jgi:hypothetical protein
MRPAKSVVFAGVLSLRGNFRGVEALSESMRPAKSVVFAGVLSLRGNFRGVEARDQPAWLTLNPGSTCDEPWAASRVSYTAPPTHPDVQGTA